MFRPEYVNTYKRSTVVAPALIVFSLSIWIEKQAKFVRLKSPEFIAANKLVAKRAWKRRHESETKRDSADTFAVRTCYDRCIGDDNNVCVYLNRVLCVVWSCACVRTCERQYVAHCSIVCISVPCVVCKVVFNCVYSTAYATVKQFSQDRIAQWVQHNFFFISNFVRPFFTFLFKKKTFILRFVIIIKCALVFIKTLFFLIFAWHFTPSVPVNIHSIHRYPFRPE